MYSNDIDRIRTFYLRVLMRVSKTLSLKKFTVSSRDINFIEWTVSDFKVKNETKLK